MGNLTESDLSFLKSHGISIDEMFDAEGLSSKNRQILMKDAGKHFYYGGAKCHAAQHQLRTRHGHCIQCDTSNIAFATRRSTDACLYVAGSLTGQITKIGSAEDVPNRLIRLRSDSYGGVNDWEILAVTSTVKNAGEIERIAQRSLHDFRAVRTYFKAGTPQEAREIFICNFPMAAQALADALVDPRTLELKCSLQTAKRYEWRNAA